MWTHASFARVDLGTIAKLIIWSLIVGVVLYWLEWSPGDIYSWIANRLAAVWHWISGTGITYILLGATIVVPVWFLMRLKERMGRR